MRDLFREKKHICRFNRSQLFLRMLKAVFETASSVTSVSHLNFDAAKWKKLDNKLEIKSHTARGEKKRKINLETKLWEKMFL